MATIHKMDVNQKVNGKYQLVGTVDVPVFDLSEFGIAVEPSGQDDEGLPTYSDDRTQFVMDALTQATKAAARNKLQPSSTQLKPGNSIASTVSELIEKAERTGAALAIAREFLASFATYLATKSGKKPAVIAIYNGLAKNRQAIALATEQARNGFAAQLMAYAEQATEEEAAKFGNILNTLSEMCSQEEAEDELEF